jgi:predicted molibdopterin-dependent oxidoreductase YjgC
MAHIILREGWADTAFIAACTEGFEAFAHTETFTRGRGAFHAVAAQLPAEQPDAAFPLILTTGRILYHYHTGIMTRRSEGLAWRESRGYAEINVQDAAAARIRDGGPVLLTSRRGQVRTQARVGQRVPPGTVFLSFHWKEAPANLLTQDFALDPLAKIPEYKVCAVRLERPRSGARAAGGLRQAPLTMLACMVTRLRLPQGPLSGVGLSERQWPSTRCQASG